MNKNQSQSLFSVEEMNLQKMSLVLPPQNSDFSGGKQRVLWR